MFTSPTSVDRLSADLQSDLLAFLPELILCGSIVLLLLLRLFTRANRWHVGLVVIVSAAAALVVAVGQWPTSPEDLGPVPYKRANPGFFGLLSFDTFGLFFRILLLAYLVLAVWLSLVTRIPDTEDAADFHCLLIGSTVGLMLMASASHLLTVFLAVEMASLPSYALAGFLKGRRASSEGALKYVVYGATASAVMLYGISLVVGHFGGGAFMILESSIAREPTSLPFPAVIGGVLILAGLGFKLSAVPFHFWAPDVFHGAAAEIGAYLSVASKAAAVALTARFLFTLVGSTGPSSLAATVAAICWGTFAVVTVTFGNLAALPQTNMKRLLAYSTIANAGFLMLAVVPVGPKITTAFVYYIAAYLPMNLGAFAVVAFVRNKTGSEEIAAYAGLVRRSPILGVSMCLCLLSLLGLPPLVGFAAKFQVFARLGQSARHFQDVSPELAAFYYALLGLAAINTALGVGYYLRVVRTMTLDEPADPSPIAVPIGGRALLLLLGSAIVAGGVFWDPLTRIADDTARTYQRMTLQEMIDEAKR